MRRIHLKVFTGIFISILLVIGLLFVVKSLTSTFKLPPEVKAKYESINKRMAELEISKLKLRKILLETQAQLDDANNEYNELIDEKTKIENEYLTLIPEADASGLGKAKNISLVSTIGDRLDLSLPVEPSKKMKHIENKSILDYDKQKVKLREFLESKNSPYSDLDIYGYADEFGVDRASVRVLVGISGKESNFGISYTCTKAGCNKAAGIDYHNPAGIKICLYSEECPTPSPIPDNKGFWLQKYETWEQFWRTYIYQMEKGYFSKDCNTAQCISKYYVGGKRGVVKWHWTNEVNNFKNQIPY